MPLLNRRKFLLGLLASPAVVHAGNLMPISARNLFAYDATWNEVVLGYTVSYRAIIERQGDACPHTFQGYEIVPLDWNADLCTIREKPNAVLT